MRYIETISDPDCSVCIHCGVYALIPEPDHAVWCPQSTAVFVITERELSEEFSCCECRREFGLREVYTIIESRALCISCGAQEAGAA